MTVRIKNCSSRLLLMTTLIILLTLILPSIVSAEESADASTNDVSSASTGFSSTASALVDTDASNPAGKSTETVNNAALGPNDSPISPAVSSEDLSATAETNSGEANNSEVSPSQDNSSDSMETDVTPASNEVLASDNEPSDNNTPKQNPQEENVDDNSFHTEMDTAGQSNSLDKHSDHVVSAYEESPFGEVVYSETSQEDSSKQNGDYSAAAENNSDVQLETSSEENSSVKSKSEIGNSYKAEIEFGDPIKPNTDTYVNEDRTFTIMFTELSSTMQLGSAEVTIPDEFRNVNNASISSSGWDFSLADKLLSFWAKSSSDYLGQDDSISVSFDATTPSYAGAYIFETEAWTAANADHSGVYGADDKINNMADGESDPEVLVGYQISDAAGLNDMRNEGNAVGGLDGHYILTDDIDLAAYLVDGGAGYNDGAGWEPIGSGSDWDPVDDQYQPFTGSFSGNSYTISNLAIDSGDQDDVGLFGFIAHNARISDLNLINVNIVGDDYVGSLVGANAGTVVDCTVHTANLKGDAYVGGLVGWNYGTISNSTATAVVITPNSESTGGNGYGGLVGANEGSITDSNVVATSVTGRGSTGGLVGANDEGSITGSSASGTVNGTERTGGLVGNNSKGAVAGSSADVLVTASGNYAGGLIGYSEDGQVNGSHAVGDVTGAGTTSGSVGGLIGYNTASESFPVFDGCTASGDVVGFRYVGGLIGQNINVALLDCHSSGSVTANYGDGETAGIGSVVGGLVGSTDASVTNCSAAGDVSGHSTVGGLAGSASAAIIGSFATGKVTGFDDGSSSNEPSSVGGLVGSLTGSITESYAEGDVSGYRYVGGLVGQATNGSIEGSYANGSVAGKGNAVGGLVGLAVSGRDPFLVSGSYAAGTVIGDGIGVGGLIGSNEGWVEESYASGAVIGLTSNVGGLVGSNHDVIFNSYASGDVSGTENVGGLAGYHTSSIENSYAVGKVVGTNDVSAGGLIGTLGSTNGGPGGQVTNSYYDRQTTGQNDNSGKGTPKSTAEMKTLVTYEGWNITGEDGSHPQLWWQLGDDDTYTWHISDVSAPNPDSGPGSGGMTGGDLIGSFTFSFPSDIPVIPGVNVLTSISGGIEAIITPVFVKSGSKANLAQAISVYQAALQNYEEEKDTLTAEQRAQIEVELAIAWAAIQTLEASLTFNAGEAVDFGLLLEAYQAAQNLLAANGSLLSEIQIAEAQALLDAIGEAIVAIS